MLFFILDSDTSTGKYVYSFNRERARPIQCMFASLKDPHFVGDRLVEFGTGCNEDCYSFSRRTGRAVISIYDLNNPRGKEKVHNLENADDGWKCWIDKEEKNVIAYDRVQGQKIISIF